MSTKIEKVDKNTKILSKSTILTNIQNFEKVKMKSRILIQIEKLKNLNILQKSKILTKMENIDQNFDLNSFSAISNLN